MVDGDTKAGTDGYKDVEGWLEDKAHAVKGAKISHALLTPGQTWEQVLTKATIKDFKQLNGLMFFVQKLKQRGMGLEKDPPLNSISEYLKWILIGSSSIRGKARFEAIEADSNIIDQAAHQLYITGKESPAGLRTKKGFGFLKKREPESNGDIDGQQ